ncbi:MFS general substrate transporter [Meredithblackwellia eburnea MCA 4105]
MATETTPLVSSSRRGSYHHLTDAELAGATLDSAIHFQPDYTGSAFVLPGPKVDFDEEEDEESDVGHTTDDEVASDDEPENQQRPDLWIILVGMWTGCFLSALDSTVVATCLSTIGTNFQVANSISWVGTSYLVSVSDCEEGALIADPVAQPLYGKCSDIFGRKATTMFSSGIFLIGSLACGLAQTYPQLLAARAFAGVGGAGLTVMIPISIVTSDLVPLRRRGTFQGLGNLAYNLGAALGGPIGGALGDTIGWRWAFLIQVPFCVLHFAMAWWKVEYSFATTPEPKTDIWAKIKRVDFLGSAILVVAVATGLVGLSLGGNELPWSDPTVWVSLIVSVVLLFAFVMVEIYVAHEPLLAPDLLFTQTPGFVSLANFFASLAQLAILYTVPVWFSSVKGMTNANAGFHLIPSVVSTSASSLLTGWWMSKTGVYKKMLLICGIVNVIGPLCMISWDRYTTPDAFFWFSMIPGGIGFGATITITLVALISAVEPTAMAAATGCSYLFRATGAVLGISLSNVVMQNTLQTRLTKVITGPGSEEIIQKIRVDMSYVRTLIPELQQKVVDAYEYSSRWVFVAIATWAFLAFLCMIPIKHHDLPTRLDRKH